MEIKPFQITRDSAILLYFIMLAVLLTGASMIPVFAEQVTKQVVETTNTVENHVTIKLACISVIFFTYCW
jgi:hypothetical protein